MAICISWRKTEWYISCLKMNRAVIETSTVFQFVSKNGVLYFAPYWHTFSSPFILSLKLSAVSTGSLGRASWAWPIVVAHGPLDNGLLCSSSEGWKEKEFAPFREKKSHFISPQMSWISQKATKVRTTPSLCPSSKKYVQMHQGARKLL